MVNVAAVEPAGTVTVAGTGSRAVLLDVSVTGVPPVGAGAVSETVARMSDPLRTARARKHDEQGAAGARSAEPTMPGVVGGGGGNGGGDGAPVWVTCTTRSQSAMYRLPEASRARPVG